MSGTETKTAEQLAGEVKTALDKKVGEVKEIAEKALAEAKATGEATEKTKEKADEALVKMNELQTTLQDIEQKLARQTDGGAETKSIGEQFTDSESYKQLIGAGGQRGRASLEIKATLTSATTDADGSVGAAIAPTRLPGIQTPPERRMTIRSLITPGRMDGNSLEYTQETGFTNNAGMVAEGARKPESSIKLDMKTTSAKVVAHYMKASRQVLDDASQLRSHIDERLLYGLALKEESQILNGDGTGQNLLGIIPQATAFSPAFVVADASPIDMIRLAMLQAVLAEYPATGHVLHPVDWAKIELTKDSTGRHIIGVPQGTAPASLWGLPVVETQAITMGKFLTGAFKLGAQLFDRWASRIEVATENEDDFVKNLVTILAEERLALAVYRPEAFVYGDIAPPAG
ncbi:MAG TPA: phage major capsid protein [Pedomonas sp.]|uniref:phage major capsid protein n=1 Tax=Pedomonas sp. TaxID=2976421 RepID=UPI002F42EEA8